jgi:hypothetical protein
VSAWRRLAVADGIELAVRDDLAAARDDTLLALRDALRDTLRALGGRGDS